MVILAHELVLCLFFSNKSSPNLFLAIQLNSEIISASYSLFYSYALFSNNEQAFIFVSTEWIGGRRCCRKLI